MGAKVANEGIGEKTPAKGMLLVVGNATRLMDGTLGGCGKLNKFAHFDVSVFDFMKDKEVQTEVLPWWVIVDGCLWMLVVVCSFSLFIVCCCQ